MNRNQHPRTRHFARLAAALGAGVVTLVGAGAGQAFADTPVQPEQPLDIADAPDCSPWSYDGLTWYFDDVGTNSKQFLIGFSDGVETCEANVSLKIYTLAGPDAAIDDPGSSLQFSSAYPLSKIEQDTIDLGGEMSHWGTNDAGVCSEFRVAIDGVEIISMRVVDNCAELPLSAGDPGDPDPTNPDDLTSGTPDPDQPGDGDNGSGSGDGVDQGGELPRTGTTSGVLVALAAGLTLAGGAALAGSRRRGATA